VPFGYVICGSGIGKHKEMAINIINQNKITWLVYTVLLGMVPIFIRILVACLLKSGTVDFFSPSDFISLGMVMQISLLTEIRYHEASDAWWKKIIVGVSVLAIVLYPAMFAFTLLSEVIKDINVTAILIVSIIMSVISFGLCWTLLDRVSHFPVAQE
jgi:hypothetical protein